MERRLTAILAADVVGYSRLMGHDEAGTLMALKERQEMVLEPVVKAHRGRIVKLMGDGVLVEFASAVNAVTAAIDLQSRMAAANDAVSDERRIVLRIGINLGDVISEGADIYGDGVNIAARLEALAEPGGICVSAKVHDEVRGKVVNSFRDMGEQSLKNIALPVRVYGVYSHGAGSPSGPFPPVSNKPSIAVLPFVNMSGDPEQQYFSDGITEDIITELSRFHELSVLARNTSFQFRNQSLDARHLGQKLRVQYVVEGSVRRVGERIRITAQLIDTGTGDHLWAERYDRHQQEIFAVQDDVVRTIVGTLVGRLDAANTNRAKRKPPASLVAYDCILRGMALLVGDADAEAEARRLYEKAVELDPNYGLAYALLAYTFAVDWFGDDADYASTLGRAIELAKKAVKLDNTSSDCYQILAWACLLDSKFDLSEQYYRQALELNPNNPFCILGMAEWFAYVGRPNEGIEWLEKVKRVDPHYNPPYFWRSVGVIYMIAQKFEDAIAAFNRSPNTPDWTHAYLAACYSYVGQQDEAGRHVAEVLRLKPNFSSIRSVAKEPFKHVADRQYLIDRLLKAGLPE